jgi:hypothetical protein
MRGLLLSRVLVLISIIAVPIVIFSIFNVVPFRLWFSDNPSLNFLILNLICPLVFSIGWLFFLILFANRFAETIDHMDKNVTVIPLRLRFFYGINALFILFIFVFPIITPIIAILSFASMAWRLTTFRKEVWDDDTKVSFGTKFLMILFSLIPIFCAICIIPEYIILSIFLWENIWIPLLPLLFIISICLCTSLAIGSLFYLIVNRGVSEYEQIFYDTTTPQYVWHIRIFEIFLFVFFLFLALFRFALIDFFYYLGFIIVAFVAVVNFINGKRRDVSFKSHFMGYVLAAVFMGSNIIIFNAEVARIVSEVMLVLSAIVFILIFFYTFFRVDESGIK